MVGKSVHQIQHLVLILGLSTYIDLLDKIFQVVLDKFEIVVRRYGDTVTALTASHIQSHLTEGASQISSFNV